MRPDAREKTGRRTIADFGDQWTRYGDYDGYFGSREVLEGYVHPFDLRRIAGCRVVDLGAGAGRHIGLFLAAGAREVVALEPSRAVDAIRRTHGGSGKVRILHARGECLPAVGADYIFSIGVLHHIPEPGPVVEAAYRCLRPGGRFIVWLYGRENNRLYLALAEPLRYMTGRLPHAILAGLVWVLHLGLAPYVCLCRRRDLPLAEYLRNFYAKMPPDKQRLILYDQLKPAYAKYYTRREAHDLLANAGFHVTLHHRMRFSWTVIGEKPATGHDACGRTKGMGGRAGETSSAPADAGESAGEAS